MPANFHPRNYRKMLRSPRKGASDNVREEENCDAPRASQGGVLGNDGFLTRFLVCESRACFPGVHEGRCQEAASPPMGTHRGEPTGPRFAVSFLRGRPTRKNQVKESHPSNTAIGSSILFLTFPAQPLRSQCCATRISYTGSPSHRLSLRIDKGRKRREEKFTNVGDTGRTYYFLNYLQLKR